MSSAPLFSIIIPTYNQSAIIKEAVCAALGMHCDGSWDFEVLVLDDASSEARQPDTSTILAEIDDPRLRCVRHATNLGRAANYRSGLQRARGRWVVICDGDDYYVDEDFLSKAANVIRDVPDLVLVGMGIALAYDDHVVPCRLVARRRIMDGRELFLNWGRLAVPHLGAVYRRDLALELGFYRCDILSSDGESLLRLVLRGKVALLPGICGHWRQHGENASRFTDWGAFAANLQSVALPAAYARGMEAFDDSILQAWERDRVEEKLLGYMTSLTLARANKSLSAAEFRLRREKAFQCRRKYGIGEDGPGRFALRWWVHENLGAWGFAALYRAKHRLRRWLATAAGCFPFRWPRCAE